MKTFYEEMVIPKKYTEINDDEMTYVNGGGEFLITYTRATILSAISILGSNPSYDAFERFLYERTMVKSNSAIDSIQALVRYYASSASGAATAAVVPRVKNLGTYQGGDLTFSMISGSLIPAYNFRV